MPSVEGVKISQLPQANTLDESDVLAGVQTGTTKKFALSTLVAWIKAHLNLTAADVGAVPTSAVGAAGGVAGLDSSGKVPAAELDLSGKQNTITASGILKGDGAGGVSAAVAGTDYQTPLTAGTDYATPGMIPAVPSISTATPQMDGTAAAGSTGDVSDAGHVHPSDTAKAGTELLAYVLHDPAGQNVAVGEYTIYNGQLYTANTAITSSMAASTFVSYLTPASGGGLNAIGAYKNNLANFVDVIGYTSSSKYTFPSDGYLVIESRRTGYVLAKLAGSNEAYSLDVYSIETNSDRWMGNTTFVRKGMKMWVNDKSSSDRIARFYALA